MSDSAYDAIVVGAGPAGTAAALVMARAGLKVALLERGEYPGAKNVQGAVLYSRMLHELVPEFWKLPDAGVERPVVEQKQCVTTEDSWITFGYKSLKFLEGVPNCYTIIRTRFDQWFAAQAEAAAQKVRSAREERLIGPGTPRPPRGSGRRPSGPRGRRATPR